MTVASSLHRTSIVGMTNRPISEVPKAPRLPQSGVIYSPAVILKPAEARALHTLEGNCANAVYPLIIARAVPPERTEINEETGEREVKSQPSLTEHIQSQRKHIRTALGIEQQLFNSGVTRLMLDTSGLDDQQQLASLAEFRQSLGDDCRHVVPVIGLGRDENNRLAAAWDRQYFTGVALRVVVSKSAAFPDAADLLQLLQSLNIKPGRVDLVVDANKVGRENIEALVEATTSFHLSVTGLARWRSVILTANGFPKSISPLPFNVVHRLTRWDLVLWKRQRHALYEAGCSELPIYGDYGMVHATTSEGGKIPQPNMRYTDERYWLVYRREQEEKAMRVVCGALVESPSFRGGQFSDGDAWIERCADGNQRNSYAQTWLRAGWQHHIAFVTSQLRGST